MTKPGLDFAFAENVERASARIRKDIVRTPLEFSPALSRVVAARVFVKWECDQTTGSFKLRGALNKIRTLTASQKRRGLVTASTGNHGLAAHHAATLEGVRLTVYLPETASPVKVARLRAAGSDLVFFGPTSDRTEIHARAEAEATGRVFISPYNDLDVIHGQGTIGVEVFADLPDADDVIVPVGGGGLIAGIGGYLKRRKPSLRVVGVEPSASAFMKASLAAGRLVDVKERPTVADAVAGGIEPGAVTFPFCRDFVDEIVTVSEAKLKDAMRTIAWTHGRVVEGAGGLPLAALMARPRSFRGRTVVLIASGKNIAPDRFADIVGFV